MSGYNDSIKSDSIFEGNRRYLKICLKLVWTKIWLKVKIFNHGWYWLLNYGEERERGVLIFIK
jgi:hypothetical protein